MTSAIDAARFADLQATAGADFVVELIDTFLHEAPGLLAELRAARAAGNADSYRRAAHSLKSNGNTFGALALAAQAREIELAGLGKPASDEARIAALEAEYARAAQALRELRDV
jgi:HPt (histidine-containing phosphotransfer) domain-containing protein